MVNTPRYALLKQLLKTKISEEQMLVGDRLPSQNELMNLYGLSFSTVTRALHELELEGVIARQQGRGTFVAAVPSAESLLSDVPRRVAAFFPASRKLVLARLCQAVAQFLPGNFALESAAFPGSSSALERYLFLHDRYDGMFFLSPEATHFAQIKHLARAYPSLVFGRAVAEEEMSFVRVDHRQAAQMAVAHLASRGHREFAMLTHMPQGEELDGYRAALHEQGLIFDESRVVLLDAQKQDGHAALLQLMDRCAATSRPPTAVLAVGALAALGAHCAAQAMGKRRPEELSIVALCDLAEENLPVAAVHVPRQELARQLAEALAALVEGRKKLLRLELSSRLEAQADDLPLRGSNKSHLGRL